MDEPLHSCSKSGDRIHTVKNGKTSDGRQRYKCMNCGKRFLKKYSYQAYLDTVNVNIVSLLKEGVGIRSTGRLLNISPKTVLSRILKLSKQIKKPRIVKGKTYEMDELCTYIGSKDNRNWVAYSIRKDTKDVIDFKVGKRTNKTPRRW